MSNLKAFKPALISLAIDLVIAIILVSLFRSSYSNDSFISDVFLYFFIIFLITLVLGIKNGLVAYITSFFTENEQITKTYNELIQYQFPKPTDWYDVENPEEYFYDVVSNKENTTDVRIYASAIVTSYELLRTTQKFIPLFLLSRLLKKALKKYLRYCEVTN